MHPALVPVYDVETGATLLRFPIDARELVASGGYSYTAPVLAPAPEPVADEAPVAPKRKR